MQVQVTSRDEIKITVNADDLALINYALTFFGSQTTGNPRWHQRDAIRAERLGQELFNVYTVVVDDQTEVA